jgi:hypothetical protein
MKIMAFYEAVFLGGPFKKSTAYEFRLQYPYVEGHPRPFTERSLLDRDRSALVFQGWARVWVRGFEYTLFEYTLKEAFSFFNKKIG